MAGLADYDAQRYLDDITGARPLATSSRYLALFTAAPTSDAGTGGTEVSGGSYARTQIAGELAAGASWTTSSSTITLGSSAPAWLTALGTNGSGVNVYDVTTGAQIGVVSAISGTTVTLTANALGASSGSSDTLAFSAFPLSSASSGSEPNTLPAACSNAAVINLPGATANWGTILAWGIYDAASGGNLHFWDYLGTTNWIPFSCTNASPGVLTTDSSSDAPPNGSAIIVTSKFGGTLPTTGGSWSGALTTANLSGSTFTAGVNTTSNGGGLFRQINQQSIPNGANFSFGANQLTLTLG
jgi:hypothetical protein